MSVLGSDRGERKGTDLLEGARTIEPFIAQLTAFPLGEDRQRTVLVVFSDEGDFYQCLFSLPPGGGTESSWVS